MDTAPRLVTILPCAYAPKELCKNHFGRNDPHARLPRKQTQRPNSILKWLPQSQPQAKPQAPKCHLLDLPVELLLEICSHLTPAPVIALAWTCKALYASIKTDTFANVSAQDEQEIRTLLISLHRDNPRHRICLPCRTLHSPSSSTLARRPNKLRSQTSPFSIHPLLQDPTLVIYLLSPDTGDTRKRTLLYALTTPHISLATLHNSICIWTLRCAGTLKLSAPDTLHALHNATFTWDISPLVTRNNLIFHAVYEITFAASPASHWSIDHTKHLLKHFDIRCCIHCSSANFLDELICYLYHDRYNGREMSCVRFPPPPLPPRDVSVSDGCGRHEHVCECVTEFTIEPIGGERRWPRGVRVSIWQWVGDKGRGDVVLRQRGMLRTAYFDAELDDAMPGLLSFE